MNDRFINEGKEPKVAQGFLNFVARPFFASCEQHLQRTGLFKQMNFNLDNNGHIWQLQQAEMEDVELGRRGSGLDV